MSDFANLLRDRMTALNLNASQLAAKVWGIKIDSRGYPVSKNRDRIGHYLSGKSFPERPNLKKIAKVLRMPLPALEATRPPPKLRMPAPRGNKLVVNTVDGPASLIWHGVSRYNTERLVKVMEDEAEMKELGLV